MEVDEIQAWLDANKDFYLKLYGLDRWDIHIEIDEDQDATVCGDCEIDPEYEKARINIYSIYHDVEDELIETLCHELEHVLCAPYDMFYDIVEKSLPEKSRKMAKSVFMSICEQARNNIGRFRGNVLELSASRVSDDPAGERLCQQPQAAEEGQQAQEEPVCSECAAPIIHWDTCTRAVITPNTVCQHCPGTYLHTARCPKRQVRPVN